MLELPKKLKYDAIAEALCEIRFDCSESSQIPEIVIGKLADHQRWRDFDKNRLPVSEIPASVRQGNPSLKVQPLLELRKSGDSRLVKIGVNVFSYHRLAPYPGWAEFQNELNEVIDFLFSTFDSLSVNRFGFRYINLFNEDEHGIQSVLDLDYQIKVSGEDLQPPLNLNFNRYHGDRHVAMIRIASPEFVSGQISRPFNALVDLDVFTPANFSTVNSTDAKSWLKTAHDFEKAQFFELFTPAMKERLVEEMEQ